MLSTLILSNEVPEMTLLTRINNNAHADMHSTPYQRENIHIRGHLLQSCFGLAKFSGFQCTKTSVNKRLKLCHAMFRLGCTRAGQSRPHIPSVKHHGGKSTALKGDMQGRRRIFLPIGNRRKRKKKRRADGRSGKV